MISKSLQYRLYAGTRKDDFSGWTKAEIPDLEGDIEVWSLPLGNGLTLDRASKAVKRFFRTKMVKINILRRDRSITDPDGDFQDIDISVLFDVDIQVCDETIRFDSGEDTYVVLSREPADWSSFESEDGAPEEKAPEEPNWASFYR